MLINNQVFNKHFQVNNKTYGSISFSKLMELPMKLPIIQRLKDADKIVEIVKYQENQFIKNKKFNFLGIINIHCCVEDNKNYLTDGQHRYESIKELLKKGYDGTDNEIILEIVTIQTKKEYEENYKIINKNTPLPEFSDTIDKNVPESVFLYFEQKFPKIWKSSNRPSRPFMNKNHFQEAVGFLVEILNKLLKCEVQTEDIIQCIDELNISMKDWAVDKFTSYRKIKHPEVMREKCRKNGECWLGMLPHVTDRYGYEWVKHIILNQTGFEVKKEKKKTLKKRIGVRIKREVWDEYVGKQYGEAHCYCCRKNVVHQSEFEAGHVVSTASLLKEGKNDDISVSNLRPICSSCNKSMGSTHMREFITEFYSKTIDSFDNDIKPIIFKNTVLQVQNELYTQGNVQANVQGNVQANVQGNAVENVGLFSSLFSF
tara:strand:+ start:660 stop:1946 length:1287 start_codon:yes stop_codon:yes gene_type:complete